MGTCPEINSTAPEDVELDFVILRYIHSLYMLISCVFSVVGNVFNILVLLKLTNISESRKILFLFLSLSDLMSGLSLIPSIPASFLNRWPFRIEICFFCSYMLLTSLGISNALIFFLAVDCYIAVKYPFKYPSWVTKRRTITQCLLMVAFMYLVTTVEFYVVSCDPSFDLRLYRGVGMCLMDFERRSMVTYVVFVYSIMMFPTAFLVLGMQASVAHTARIQARRIGDLQVRFDATRVVDNAMPQRLRQKRQANELKGVYVCLVVSICFFAGWLPTAGFQIYLFLSRKTGNNIYPFAWLSTAQCWINTLAYMIIKKNYRQTLKSLLESMSRYICYKPWASG